MSRLLPVLLLLFLPACSEEASPDSRSLTIAVASNFATTAKIIATDFEEETGIDTVLIPGSTGKLTAQILQGAPYHVFLSADREAPAFLRGKNQAVPGSQFTYALGRLVLYSRESGFVDPEAGGIPEKPIQHLAIANPELAPYGKAAQEVLEKLGQWETFEASLVRGESISQAWHFVDSGNAELGFVALSQLSPEQRLRSWIVPANLHSPIEQDAILMEDTPAGRKFLEYLRSDPVRKRIRQQGYELPPLPHAE